MRCRRDAEKGRGLVGWMVVAALSFSQAGSSFALEALRVDARMSVIVRRLTTSRKTG